jgi:hypothetical protein
VIPSHAAAPRPAQLARAAPASFTISFHEDGANLLWIYRGGSISANPHLPLRHSPRGRNPETERTAKRSWSPSVVGDAAGNKRCAVPPKRFM